MASKKKSAGARSFMAAYPGQRPVNDPWIDALRNEGIQFWGKRGVRIDPNTGVDVADDLGIPDPGMSIKGRGSKSGRPILSSRDIGIELRRARSKRRGVSERRQALERVAWTLFHELGHVGGQHHTPDGIMGPVSNDIPYEAKILIRKMIRGVSR